MRKFKTTLGTTAVAFAVLTTSVLGGTSVSFAKDASYDMNENIAQEFSLGDVELTEEERQWLDENTKKISDVSDLNEFYNETGSNYLNNVRRFANVLSAPNNILGIEYLKSL